MSMLMKTKKLMCLLLPLFVLFLLLLLLLFFLFFYIEYSFLSLRRAIPQVKQYLLTSALMYAIILMLYQKSYDGDQ